MLNLFFPTLKIQLKTLNKTSQTSPALAHSISAMLLKMVKKQEPEHKPKKTQRRAKRRDRT
jgi:hypothetical protein